jgi:hypothetical protein
VTSTDVINLVTGTLIGIGTSTVFILALFLGFCIILGFPKLRVTAGRKFMTIKSLDETVGQAAYAKYLPADAPRGPVDQLRTPELLEHKK